MVNLGLVILCLAIGYSLRIFKKLPANASASINGVVIYVSLPAATLLYLHGLTFSTDTLYPVLMAWVLFLLGAGFFWGVGKLKNWSPRTIGSLILTGAISNTSFVGFPLLLALYGPEALKIGILTDQPGSFLVLSTLGLLTASLCVSGQFSPRETLRRVLGFPPFYALLLALFLSSYEYPPWMNDLLEKLAATLIPLSLLSVGFQLDVKLHELRSYWSKLGIGLGYKLLLGPLLLSLLFITLLGANGEIAQITIVQAAMAPMITGAIVANEYDLDPPLANLMVGIGIPLSLVTVPIWAFLLRSV